MNNNYATVTSAGTISTVSIPTGNTGPIYSTSGYSAGVVMSPYIPLISSSTSTSGFGSILGNYTINFNIADFFSAKKRKGTIKFYNDFAKTKDYRAMKRMQDSGSISRKYTVDDWFVNPNNSNPWGNVTWTV